MQFGHDDGSARCEQILMRVRSMNWTIGHPEEMELPDNVEDIIVIDVSYDKEAFQVSFDVEKMKTRMKHNCPLTHELDKYQWSMIVYTSTAAEQKQADAETAAQTGDPRDTTYKLGVDLREVFLCAEGSKPEDPDTSGENAPMFGLFKAMVAKPKQYGLDNRTRDKLRRRQPQQRVIPFQLCIANRVAELEVVKIS